MQSNAARPLEGVEQEMRRMLQALAWCDGTAGEDGLQIIDSAFSPEAVLEAMNEGLIRHRGEQLYTLTCAGRALLEKGSAEGVGADLLRLAPGTESPWELHQPVRGEMRLVETAETSAMALEKALRAQQGCGLPLEVHGRQGPALRTLCPVQAPTPNSLAALADMMERACLCHLLDQTILAVRCPIHGRVERADN